MPHIFVLLECTNVSNSFSKDSEADNEDDASSISHGPCCSTTIESGIVGKINVNKTHVKVAEHQRVFIHASRIIVALCRRGG
jgi:hypothetical protein